MKLWKGISILLMLLFAVIFIFNYHILDDIKSISNGYYAILSAYLVFMLLPRLLTNESVQLTKSDKIYVAFFIVIGIIDLILLIHTYLESIKIKGLT